MKSSQKSSNVPFGVRWRHYNSSGEDPSFFGDGKFLTKIFANLRRREHLPNHKKNDNQITINWIRKQYRITIKFRGQKNPPENGWLFFFKKKKCQMPLLKSLPCISVEETHYFYLSLFSGSNNKNSTIFFFSLPSTTILPIFADSKRLGEKLVRLRRAVSGVAMEVPGGEGSHGPPGTTSLIPVDHRGDHRPWRGFCQIFWEKHGDDFCWKSKSCFLSKADSLIYIPQGGPANWELQDMFQLDFQAYQLKRCS